MADLYNLSEELEDREAEILGPSQDDNDNDDALGEDRDGTDGEAYASETGGSSNRRAAPRLPPALAEAERIRSRRTDDGEGDEGGSEAAGEDGGPYGDDDYDDPYGGTQDSEADGDGGDDGAGGGAGPADPEFEHLKSFWAQELMCPEILPNEEEMVALHLELLRGQEDTIDELREHAAGGGGADGRNADPMLAHLAAGIYKMEADRVRFLLADLTRTRMHKIERHALHNREMVDRMSQEEVSYLKKYGQLLERHFNRSVLDHLPSKGEWSRLDAPEMIDRPDLDEYVFCRVLEKVEIDNSVGEEKATNSEEEDEVNEDNVQEFPAGSCLIARYATVQDYVLQGKVVLLM